MTTNDEHKDLFIVQYSSLSKFYFYGGDSSLHDSLQAANDDICMFFIKQSIIEIYPFVECGCTRFETHRGSCSYTYYSIKAFFADSIIIKIDTLTFD